MVGPVKLKRHVHRAAEARLFTAAGFGLGLFAAVRVVLGG